jgi:hypothetical protein
MLFDNLVATFGQLYVGNNENCAFGQSCLGPSMRIVAVDDIAWVVASRLPFTRVRRGIKAGTPKTWRRWATASFPWVDQGTWHVAGKSLGCSADVGDFSFVRGEFVPEKLRSDDSLGKAAQLAYGLGPGHGWLVWFTLPG